MHVNSPASQHKTVTLISHRRHCRHCRARCFHSIIFPSYRRYIMFSSHSPPSTMRLPLLRARPLIHSVNTALLLSKYIRIVCNNN